MQQSIKGSVQESIAPVEPEPSPKIQARPRSLQTILLVVKLLAGLALLVLSVHGIQFTTLSAGLRSAAPVWLGLSILMVLLGLAFKLWRWQMFVRNYQIHATSARLFSAYFVGQAANIILPLRGGELIRLGYFGNEKEILPEAASTIILEKYLDLLALTVCYLLVSIKFSLDNVMNLRGWLLPVTIVISALFVLIFFFAPSLWVKFHDQPRIPRRLLPWLDRWVQASLWLRSPRRMIPAVLVTILIWAAMWGTNLTLFHALGLPLGASAGGLVLVLVYLGLLPALMPGNIGPFYFFARLALLPFGILNDQAIAYAVLLHAIVTLPPLLAGVVGLLIRSTPPTRL